MRFQSLLLAAFFPLLCVASHAQSQFDGDFWIPKSKDAKLLYAVETLGMKIDDPRISKLASNVTVGQIIDGVDKFYKDWRNRTVLLRHAMQYVLDEAQGKDDCALLLYMRQADSEQKK